MIDSKILLDIGQQRQRDLLVDAAARRRVRQLSRKQRPARLALPALLLRLLVTMGF